MALKPKKTTAAAPAAEPKPAHPPEASASPPPPPAPKAKSSIPLFNSETLVENLKALGPELLNVIREEAEAFVKENRESALELTDETIKAVLVKDAFEQIAVPEIPPPGEGTLEQRAQIEAYLAARSEIFSLVASADLKHAEKVAALKSKARAGAAKVLAIVLGLGFKAVLGG